MDISRRRTVCRAALKVVLVAVAAALSFASTAHAATELESSSPADGAQLVDPLSEVQLTFNLPVPSSVVAALACGGSPAPVGPLAVNQRVVTLPVTGPLPVGPCIVTFGGTDAQQQSFSGCITFTVTQEAVPATTSSLAPTTPAPTTTAGPTVASTAPPAATAVTTPPSTVASSSPTSGVAEPGADVGFPLGALRVVQYLGLLCLFGALVFLVQTWPEGAEYVLTLRFVRTTWVAALVGTGGVVVLSTARLPGNTIGGSLAPTAWGDLLDTTTGKFLLARLVLVAASGWVALHPHRVLDPAVQVAAIGIPGLAVATFGFTRTGGSLGLLGNAAGVAHVLSVSVWFGGLVLLSRVVLSGPGDEDLVHATAGFSRVANPAIFIAVISGLVETFWLDRGTLFSTDHGRLLMVKVLLVLAMVYLGTMSRRVIARRIGRAHRLEAATAAPLRRALGTEALIGVLVLALTAWVVSSLVPSPAYAYRTVRTHGEFDIRLFLDPQRTGPNAMRLELFQPAEGVANFTVTFTPPADTAASEIVVNVPLAAAGAVELPEADGLPFTVPGPWTITIAADGPSGPLKALTSTVEISGQALG